MIIKKILVAIFFLLLSGIIFFVLFWDIPAPTKKIEKSLDVHRFNKNDKD